jgi:hypothetical protein
MIRLLRRNRWLSIFRIPKKPAGGFIVPAIDFAPHHWPIRKGRLFYSMQA